MKLSRLSLNTWTVLLLANLWLCQAALAADTPPGKQGAEVALNQKAQALVQSQLREQTAALETRQGELEKRVLETERKSIDWWLTAIGIGLTVIGLVVAVAGVLLPLYWQRSERSRLRQAQAEFDRMQALAQKTLAQLSQHEQAGANSLANTRAHEAQADETRKKMAQFQPPSRGGGSNESTESSKNTDAIEAAKAIDQDDANTSDADKLRARAIKASRIEHPTTAEVMQTYEIWFALTVLHPQDENAHFNAGYEAQNLFEMSASPGRAYWLDLLGKHYEKALDINKNLHEAAFNWGIALAAEAQALKDQDPRESNALWKSAGEKYALALEIEKDMHEAANNWGGALNDEAQALKDQDLPAARALWKAAGEKYALALEIKKDDHEAAYNWGSALLTERHAIKDSAPAEAAAVLAQAQSLLVRHRDMSEAAAKVVAYNLACVWALQNQAGLAVAQLELCRLSGELEAGPSHWRTDADLDPIRQSPEYQKWFQENFPNESI